MAIRGVVTLKEANLNKADVTIDSSDYTLSSALMCLLRKKKRAARGVH
ncbi:MAG: hypothetical protein IJK81_04750 [Selenomonadaceae bacterium]|nr:hypothetical protein [Selenomonadaceae bacterium]